MKTNNGASGSDPQETSSNEDSESMNWMEARAIKNGITLKGTNVYRPGGVTEAPEVEEAPEEEAPYQPMTRRERKEMERREQEASGLTDFNPAEEFTFGGDFTASQAPVPQYASANVEEEVDQQPEVEEDTFSAVEPAVISDEFAFSDTDTEWGIEQDTAAPSYARETPVEDGYSIFDSPVAESDDEEQADDELPSLGFDFPQTTAVEDDDEYEENVHTALQSDFPVFPEDEDEFGVFNPKFDSHAVEEDEEEVDTELPMLDLSGAAEEPVAEVEDDEFVPVELEPEDTVGVQLPAFELPAGLEVVAAQETDEDHDEQEVFGFSSKFGTEQEVPEEVHGQEEMSFDGEDTAVKEDEAHESFDMEPFHSAPEEEERSTAPSYAAPAYVLPVDNTPEVAEDVEDSPEVTDSTLTEESADTEESDEDESSEAPEGAEEVQEDDSEDEAAADKSEDDAQAVEREEPQLKAGLFASRQKKEDAAVERELLSRLEELRDKVLDLEEEESAVSKRVATAKQEEADLKNRINMLHDEHEILDALAHTRRREMEDDQADDDHNDFRKFVEDSYNNASPIDVDYGDDETEEDERDKSGDEDTRTAVLNRTEQSAYH